MPTFAYTARSRSGEKVTGDLEAKDRRTALADIERQGLIPVSVKEGSAAAAGKAKAKGGKRFQLARPDRMTMREVLIFTTELSDLLASGMTLGNALNTLASRRSGKGSDTIIGSLRNEIVRGTSLSDALALHPKIFTNLYVNMIRAGEASGALHEVLMRLVEHYERLQDLKEKVVMALVYPMIVVIMGVATLIFAMVSIVPKFQALFDGMGQALPLPTRILIGSSEFMTNYGLVVLGVVAVVAVVANRWVATKRGRIWWHGMLLRMPLIKGIVASGIYANFARTLGTLLGNGVAVLQALKIVGQTVGNAVIARELDNARDRVTDGTSISGPLAAGKVFPEMMTDMLSIGEQTGDMVSALTHIARRYENELDRNVKIFTAALEPLLIVFVAFGVGFVAIAILMAVFEITSGMGV
ncbi:MAG: type II secretion system F family protein [Verrucomicrobia bacterium]|jgi:type IV pilus assembly protein PilC|nr:type II secretion system F family protein [Verrucomicrobiota bacterium]